MQTRTNVSADKTLVRERKREERRATLAKFRGYKYLYLLMIPGALWFLCFHLLPLYGISIAFMDYSPKTGFASEFVGLFNFRVLFSNDEFAHILWNTVKISFLKIIFGFPMPILLALSINAARVKWFRKIAQTISYLPNFISWMIVFTICIELFNSYTGVFAGLCKSLGIPYTDPTLSAGQLVGFLVFTSVWKSMGMGSIIYLAALSGIDQQLYEAASVDGANSFRKLCSITLPSIAPVMAVVLILNIGQLLGGDFEQIYLFQRTSDELVAVSEIFETYIYRNGIRAGNFSLPAAMGIFQSTFGAILIVVSNKVANRLGYEGIW